MSKKNLEQFCLLVLQNLELQNQLKGLTGLNEFIPQVIELGRENGFEFSQTEVENKMRENRRQWHERWL